jgi:hypothetical protein
MRATHTARRIVSSCIALAGLALALAAAPAIAAGPPILAGTSASHVGTASATLEATVNPNSRKVEFLHFLYVDQAGFEAEGFAAAKSTPDEALPTGTAAVPVSAQIAGLKAATTYHYRLIAHNSLGITEGAEASFATFAQAPTFEACPNDAFRSGHPSAALPDCRAYEQASPVDKNGADMGGQLFKVQASASGDAITSQVQAGIPGGVGAQNFPIFRSARGPAAWSTAGFLPPPTYGLKAEAIGWTPDLAYAFSNPAPVDSDLVGGLDFGLVERSSASGSFKQLIPYTDKAQYSFAGGSADDSKLFFEVAAPGSGLAPGAAAGADNLYLWDRDTESLSTVGVLPDSACGSPPCTPPGGSFAGPYDWWGDGFTPPSTARGGAATEYFTQELHAISAAGDKAYFSVGGGQLYLRKGLGGSSPETVPVSASQRSSPDPAGNAPAAFMGASKDGSAAFFTSREKLTDDATTGPPQPPPLIGRANVADGAGKEESFLSAGAAGIAVFGEHIYWANPSAGTIGRAKLNGSGAPSLIEPNFIDEEVGRPQYVAVDSEHVYWTNAGDGLKEGGTIGRAGPEGEDPELDFITGASNPQGLAVNASNIYWVNGLDSVCDSGGCHAPMKSIARAKLNGAGPASEVDQKFVDLDPQTSLLPEALTLDAAHIYWTIDSVSCEGCEYIERSDLDGQNRKSRLLSLTEYLDPRGIAVDAGHVYWAAQKSGQIGRMNIELEEASIEADFVDPEGRLKGLALDGEHIYWSADGEPQPNPGNDLYRYDAQTGALSDLAVDSDETNGAEVLGVLGTSQDGSYVYFAANGDLDGPGGEATPGNCADIDATFKASGVCNLYLWHGGAISFIARLDASGKGGSGGSSSDAVNLAPNPRDSSSTLMNTARVSADGKTLVFRSQRKLSAYENAGTPEFYRYHVGDPSLLCVSCNPTGVAPVGMPTLQTIKQAGEVQAPAQPILDRFVSADGERVFFESLDKLVAADVNGEAGCPLPGRFGAGRPCQDVYEWEAEGSGSCHSASQNGGCLYLLSSGTSASPAFLGDADEEGENVFIFTREKLVPQDADQVQDIYDVKTLGGLASQNQPPPSPPCEGEACRGPAGEIPSAPGAGSATLSGPGNAKAKKPKPRCQRRKKRHAKPRCARKRTHKHSTGGRR